MLALFDWARSAGVVRTRAATARDNFVMLRISLLLGWCRAISQLECHAAPPPSKDQSGQGLCQLPVSCALSNSLTKQVGTTEAKIGLRVSLCNRWWVLEL